MTSQDPDPAPIAEGKRSLLSELPRGCAPAGTFQPPPPGSVSRRPVLPAARLSCHGDTQRHDGESGQDV